MRKLDIGTDRFTKVVVVDEPGEGGACHQYRIRSVPISPPTDPAMATATEFAYINFQDGPIKENDINGCHHEDLIAIVIDRLQHFQKGEWACHENALAKTKLEEAMHWLNHRTANRIARGVEGTNKL